MSADNERTNPFVGLRPFFDEDAFYFFGRGEQTSDLLQLLHAHRFVPVLGSSGSGKSSLVRAGLIPLLQGGFLVSERDGWRMAKCRPGEAPLENLAEALQYAMGEGRAPAAAALLAQRMREEHTDAIVEYVRPRLKGTENLFILVDQFEELFAFRSAGGGDGDDEPGTTPDAERIAERIRRRQDASSLVSLLLALSRQKELPVYVSITMRTDFLGDCDLFEGLPESINASGYLVPRLTRKQLRECVVGPARLHGAQVAPRLVDRVLNDVGDRGDQLPVLQHALLRTWERWEAGGRVGPLDLTHFEQAGGLDGALAQQADKITASADPVMVERIFKRLTTTDTRRRRVRSPARLSELIGVSGAPPDAVKALLARCVAEGVNFLYAAPDGKPGDPRYDIVHESLIRQWPTLRGWVDEERDTRDWWQDMARKAQADAESPGDDLLSPRAVQGALERLAHRPPTAEWAARYAGEGAASFEATLAYIIRSRDAVRRRRQRRIQWIGGTVLCFVVLGIYGAYNGWLADTILRRSEADSRKVAIERLAVDDPTYATALAAELTPEELGNPDKLALVQQVLAGAVAVAEYDSVADVALSDSGTHVALAMLDASVMIRRTDGTGSPVRVMADSLTPSALRFAHDGKSLFVASTLWTSDSIAGRVDRLDRESGRVLNTWAVPSGPVFALRVSPDGRHLVVLAGTGAFHGSREGGRLDSLPVADVTVVDFMPTAAATLVVGTSSRGSKLLRLDLSESRTKVVRIDTTLADTPRSLAFHPSRDAFVMTGERWTTRLYSTNGAMRPILSPLVSSAAFSPDGAWLALGTAVGAVEVVDSDSLSLAWRLSPHTQYVTVAFSSSSEAVISVSADGTGRWTSVRDTSRSVKLLGHREDPSALVAATAGHTVATMDIGGVVRLWTPPEDWGDFLPPSDLGTPRVAMLSDNGKVLVSGFQDGSLLAQFPTNDHPPVPIRPAADGTEFLEPLAVSPAGEQVLITVNAGSEARLWTPTSTAPTPVALGETARIMKAAFSGDGRTVVLAVDDGTVRLVDARRGTEREQVEVCASTIEQLAVSVDGNRFAAWCTDEPFVHIRTPEGMRQAHADWINPVRVLRFSPDSTSLLIAGVGFNRVLVETRGAARTRTLLGSGDNVYAAAFSHDGRQIVTGAWDKTVEVFTVPPFDRDTTIQPESVSADTVLKGHRFPVLHVAFGARDRTIVSTGSDGGVHVWQPRGNGYRRVVLVHPQRLPPSSFVEKVATAYLEERRMVVSTAISEQSSESASGQSFVARFRRWDMQPDSLLARLARRTTVCVPLAYRRMVVPVEQDAAEARTNACLTRNGRAAK